MTRASTASVGIGTRLQSRDGTGRFASVHAETVLLAAVPDVARNVARRLDKKPEEITQAEWNTGRHAVRTIYGDLPRAHQVCLRLANRDGAWPWRDLLALTLDPSRDAKKTYEERLSEPDRKVSPGRVAYALLFVARYLGRPTLLPREYEETRAQLLAGDQGVFLKDVLPSRGQIETACGGWDEALQVAGLAPRPTVAAAGASDDKLKEVPIREAIVAFCADNGRLPSRDEVDSYLHVRGCALPDDAEKDWWAELAAAATAVDYLHETGALAKAETGGADKRIRYTHVDVVRAVRQFINEGCPQTDKQWRAFQRGRDGIPSLNVVKNHGGLRNLVREAAHPDWLQRAKQWDASSPSKPSRPQGRPKSHKRDLIIDAIKKHGELGVAGLADELRLPRDQVRHYLRELKSAGLITATNPAVNARNQTYRLRSA